MAGASCHHRLGPARRLPGAPALYQRGHIMFTFDCRFQRTFNHAPAVAVNRSVRCYLPQSKAVDRDTILARINFSAQNFDPTGRQDPGNIGKESMAVRRADCQCSRKILPILPKTCDRITSELLYQPEMRLDFFSGDCFSITMRRQGEMTLDIADRDFAGKLCDHLLLDPVNIIPNSERFACEGRTRARVKFFEQRTLPVAPHGRPHTVQVRVSEHKEHVKHIETSHLCSEVFCQAGLAKIATLRDMGHQNMMLDQSDDFGFAVRIKTEPIANTLGNTRTAGNVSPPASLTQVVQ